jgi:hypothetical protein
MVAFPMFDSARNRANSMGVAAQTFGVYIHRHEGFQNRNLKYQGIKYQGNGRLIVEHIYQEKENEEVTPSIFDAVCCLFAKS